jgi:hypothetical protein
MNRTTDHIKVEVKGNFAHLHITDSKNGEKEKISVFAKDWYQYANPKSKILLQDAFPYLTIKSRDLIKIGFFIDTTER